MISIAGTETLLRNRREKIVFLVLEFVMNILVRVETRGHRMGFWQASDRNTNDRALKMSPPVSSEVRRVCKVPGV